MSTTREIPVEPNYLRAGVATSAVGVDRENKVILGYVLAQEGDFKSKGRGSFDDRSLKKIVTLMRKEKLGTKVRFGHPTLSDDGLAKFVGRAKNPRLDSVTVERPEGIVSLLAIRADLHIADVAMKPSETGFSLGEYVLDRAEEDPDSFSSSLVVGEADMEDRLDSKGRPLLDADGRPLPPIWRPKSIHASDIVDRGDAVDGFLSAGLPDEIVRSATALLDKQFSGQDRETVKARCLAWLDRYLSFRFGEEEQLESETPEPTPEKKPVLPVDEARRRTTMLELS